MLVTRDVHTTWIAVSCVFPWSLSQSRDHPQWSVSPDTLLVEHRKKLGIWSGQVTPCLSCGGESWHSVAPSNSHPQNWLLKLLLNTLLIVNRQSQHSCSSRQLARVDLPATVVSPATGTVIFFTHLSHGSCCVLHTPEHALRLLHLA